MRCFELNYLFKYFVFCIALKQYNTAIFNTQVFVIIILFLDVMSKVCINDGVNGILIQMINKL